MRDITIYEDPDRIRQAILHLRQKYPEEKVGGLQVPFVDGNLKYSDHIPYIYDRQSRCSIPDPNYNLVKRDNSVFVDAIQYSRVVTWAPRKGSIAFIHPDGRTTHMSPNDFEKIADKMVRGWLIGRFKYRQFYGSWHIECVEVLV